MLSKITLRVIKYLSVILVLTILRVDFVYAEDTENLLNLYGMTLGSPSKSSVEDEIDKIQQDLVSATLNKSIIDQQNRISEKQAELNKKKVDSINKNIDILMNNNLVLENKLGNEILTADISTLLGYDSEYKSNVASANDLLKTLDYYNFDITYRLYDYDLEGLEEQLKTQKIIYAESLDTFNLGDVTNVRFPLDRERYVTSKFGTRIDPLNNKVTRFHSGTDYRAEVGTKVLALFNGTVKSAGWSDTMGYYVIIQHGENVKTLVCHLSEILVNEGQEVNQYDVIALSGGTGSRSTGPHLHLALYLNGSTYNVDTLFQ